MNNLKKLLIFTLLVLCLISCNKELTVTEFLERNPNIEVALDYNIILDKEKNYNFLYDCTKGYTLTISKNNYMKSVLVLDCDWVSLKDNFDIDYEMSFIEHMSFAKVKVYKLKFRKL